MKNETIQLLYFTKKVNDKKHGVKFDKDKVSYRGHTFDAVLSKAFRAHMENVMREKGLQLPLIIELLKDPSKKHYFTKPKQYTFVDSATGETTLKTKTVMSILSCVAISQGEFKGSKSIDDIVDEIDGIEEEE